MPVATPTRFPPSREAALSRLHSFVPKAGEAYAKGRNFDRGEWERQSVSGLSPYLSRRMITEAEVVDAVLEHHDLPEAEKYLQEICWRTYWKGWLEQRPEVWTLYRQACVRQEKRIQGDGYQSKGLEAARAGRTSITAFNHWVEELKTHGYLHNHARMWFAGIWVFDFGLPWELGAEFFYEHLLDRDAASNTLSWRWVSGLQTPGKRYLPSACNIEKYTEGRFDESDTLHLKKQGPEFEGFPPRERLTFPDHEEGAPETLLLCKEDFALDLPLEWTGNLKRVILLDMEDPQIPTSDLVVDFDRQALRDAQAKWASLADTRIMSIPEFQTWWWDHASAGIAMPWIPVGPVRDLLQPVWKETELFPRTLLRAWDEQMWPHARSGFFGFWKNVRPLLG